MKNILYIGPYKELNGLGYSAKRWVNCLSQNSNFNLAIRPIFFTKNINLDNNQYVEFEENSFKYYDAIIQHGYPDVFEYHRDIGKNIGITQIETRNIQHTGWIEKINLLDEIIVESVFSGNSLLDSGVKCPIRLIPQPYDLSLFNNNYTNFFKYENNKPFIFYTIGQYTDQKNIKNIILSYLDEFSKDDNVKLFIKTGDYSKEPSDLSMIIDYDISIIKKIIRKNNCPDIDVITGHLTDRDILRLHNSADCYINAVKSDSFGSSAIEAALFDNVVINTKNIGTNTYLNSKNSLVVNSQPCNIITPYFYNKNTFTLKEEWHDPDISDIKYNMRKAYEMSADDKQILINNFDKSVFDYKSIGSIIL